MISGLPQLSEYIDAAFASDNQVTHIYMGLNPVGIWEGCERNEERFRKHLQTELSARIEAHPEAKFEILFPFSSLDGWVELTTKEREEIRGVYLKLLAELEEYENVKAYFMGAAHWLIANPGNYKEGSVDIVNDAIAHKILLYTFVDGEYVITATNADTLFGMLNDIIAKEETSPNAYPDLSDWRIVFFGDSIIGNYVGSFSVPGVVAGLSGAEVYNCGVGGSSATFFPESSDSSPGIGAFLSKDAGNILNGDKKTCFVLNYGLNDYFQGSALDNEEDSYDSSTYSGALRCDVRVLRTAYPDARIVLNAPTFTSYFEHGQEVQSEKGGRLTDYVEAAKHVAEEMGLFFLNSYEELGIDESNYDEWLADGCHLNEEGRFLMAQHLIRLTAAPEKRF